ncbi:MAG: hypothetical protein GY906_28330 [bacterium]|nr:hypothetical protein [bacterium]
MSNLPVKFDADMRHRYLQLYRLCGQIQRAAKSVGISPTTVRQLLKDDPDFADAHNEAYGDFQEAIEREAIRRAIMGWEEPVFQQGELAGHVRKYDSRLLELVLKRHNPEYKESFQHNHTVGGGVLVVPQLESEDEWEKRNRIDVADAEVIEEEEQPDDAETDGGVEADAEN